MTTLLLSIGVQIIRFGILAGIGLYLDVFLFVQRLHASSINLPASINPPAWQGFLANFYGALDEEILLRLFVLTLLAWIGSRFSRTKEGRPTLAVLWIANLLAAILFGLGHLPATQAAGFPLNGLVIGLALVLNGLVGIATGWLYWSRGLGSAMLAHFSGDILLHVILPVLI